MPKRRPSSSSQAAARRRWIKGASHHPPDVGLAAVPLELGGGRRERRRRGGPRAPLLLLPLIAVGAGVGVAYVSQTAHGTQATYEATALTSQRDALRKEDEHLADDLARLRSAERIIAAAQRLGMRPAGQWLYSSSPPSPVISAPHRLTADGSTAAGSVLDRLGSALTGTFGPGNGGAEP